MKEPRNGGPTRETGMEEKELLGCFHNPNFGQLTISDADAKALDVGDGGFVSPFFFSTPTITVRNEGASARYEARKEMELQDSITCVGLKARQTPRSLSNFATLSKTARNSSRDTLPGPSPTLVLK
eukprot:Hpha_TRINITY_DN15288_c0_g1::TRINITY_DN15288_c0_g1_i1::g.66802::m.66802